MAREYFCAYHSLLQSIEPLSDAERGRLFTACLEYSKTGVAPELCGNERFIFPTIKEQIDRDVKKYGTKSQALSENGKKGGRPKKQMKAEKANGFFESKKSQEEDKEEDKDKDKDKDKKTLARQAGRECVHELEEGFSLFWKAYPRKVGKQDAFKAWGKIKPEKALLAAILEKLELFKRTDSWLAKNGRYVPHPSTWLNGKRWEDELPNTGHESAGHESFYPSDNDGFSRTLPQFGDDDNDD